MEYDNIYYYYTLRLYIIFWLFFSHPNLNNNILKLQSAIETNKCFKKKQLNSLIMNPLRRDHHFVTNNNNK